MMTYLSYVGCQTGFGLRPFTMATGIENGRSPKPVWQPTYDNLRSAYTSKANHHLRLLSPEGHGISKSTIRQRRGGGRGGGGERRGGGEGGGGGGGERRGGGEGGGGGGGEGGGGCN
ncbi:hypothetical protein O3M35_012277 [Rhynocoris fuscipes]|uniref:Uncharacterized protein n=1 Tax=Rhynocoris fuscipes TaxID=488301 RepID=A0AAW1CUC7_9HEMI